MAHINDIILDIVENSWTEPGQSAADAAITVTHAAEAGRRHAIVRCDASYSVSTASGELTVLFGATIIARKDIHGDGSIEFGHLGLINPDSNELVRATLATGGSGNTGDVTLTGYTTGPSQ